MNTTTATICNDCASLTSGHCWRHPLVHAAGWPVYSAIPQTLGTFVTPDHLCPDLLRYDQIGAADGWRGRAVRGFFFVLRVWPPRR